VTTAVALALRPSDRSPRRRDPYGATVLLRGSCLDGYLVAVFSPGGVAGLWLWVDYPASV